MKTLASNTSFAFVLILALLYISLCASTASAQHTRLSRKSLGAPTSPGVDLNLPLHCRVCKMSVLQPANLRLQDCLHECKLLLRACCRYYQCPL